MAEKNLKQTTVKCHGGFKPNLKIDGKIGQVTITFLADEKTLDLNKLAAILKDGATAIFVSDQTELPTDDGKDKDKPADGQLSLLDGGKAKKA